MQCDEVRALLQANAYETEPEPEVSGHLVGCADCRAHGARLELLNELLDNDEGTEPRPGFDTRFFARLEELKAGEHEGAPARARARWLRWLMAAVPVVAAATLLVMTIAPDAGPALEDDLSLAMELEMIEEIEVVRSLDEIEAYEILAQLDPNELDAMLEGVPQ